MKIKVNNRLAPVKAHYFFFFAALGPILPQLNVFGRQMGASAAVMGLVTAVLPLLWAAAKPLCGYVVDYWPNHRKLVFMFLITLMTGSYCGLWFIPDPDKINNNNSTHVYKLNDTVYLKKYRNTTGILDNTTRILDNITGILDQFTCHWRCDKKETNFNVFMTNSTYINTIYLDLNEDNISCSLLHMVMDIDTDSVSEGERKCVPKKFCDFICFKANTNDTGLKKPILNGIQTKREGNNSSSGNLENIYKQITGLERLINGSQTRKKINFSSNDSLEKTNNNLTNIEPILNGSNITTNVKNTSNDNFENTNINLVLTNIESIINGSLTRKDVKNYTNLTNTEPISDENMTVYELKHILLKRLANKFTNKNSTELIQDLSWDDFLAIAFVLFAGSEDRDDEPSLYSTAPFWVFVALMCAGTVAFNVANCIGDAVCFDVLGEQNQSKYGRQRMFGTIGYGITALLGGWLVDQASGDGRKDFTPAFVIALICTAVDLYSCRRLTLPPLSTPVDSGKELLAVLKIPRVLCFILLAVVAGTFDSFIIYYMFWFLEELAEQTGSMGQIKLIEGVVVAGQSFIGELVFFALSGKIINRLGYPTTLSLSLFCYGVRMALISFITHPWQLVAIESIMQGPTYALCYSAIVGYAAHVAPEGYSATVQGIVGGMDDGLGFAIGSFAGGLLYSAMGARMSFRILSGVACITATLHGGIFYFLQTGIVLKEPDEPIEEGEIMIPMETIGSGAIYSETTVSFNNKTST